MIIKINKIKKLGLFDAYTPIAGLKDFKQYNLIYGWNGSGKTTFSKLFDALEKGSHQDYPTLEFEIENSALRKFQQGQTIDQKVRVFNQDYIENNLQIRDGKAKSITLVLGSASKEILEETEKDEQELARKNDEAQKEKTGLENKDRTKGKTFTEVAKTIYVAITGGATRNYRKDNAETDFALLTGKSLLPDEVLQKLAVTVKQLQKPTVDQLKPIEIDLDQAKGKEPLADVITKMLPHAKDLLSIKVESIVIDRLAKNVDISDWVERGLGIHKYHTSENCEFCGQKIPEARLQEFAKHFNEADKELKAVVENLIKYISLGVIPGIKTSESIPDSARLYDEFGEAYKEATTNLSQRRSELLIELEKVITALKEKKSKTTESVDFDLEVDPTPFKEALDSVNVIIQAHNKKTTDFEKAKNEATEKIKKHYLSTIFDEIKDLERGIKDHRDKIGLLINGDPLRSEDLGITQLKNRIGENRAKISSTHKACADINAGLATFLGRQELSFEPHKKKVLNEKGEEAEIEDGYLIKRDGKPVTHLSEGEKTAIAFVYFTIHLNDPSFHKDKDIVVIDDPISSLDSNSIFQAFSFLKNSVKDAEQVFIMTHNFDFLRLVLNWLNNRRIKSNSSFYMIKNKDTVDGRVAFLDELDKDLREHESEYNYLFSLLHGFHSDGTIASVYHMPNIARKVLETFLMFRVPNSDSTYQKMESLKPLFDENKLTAIYKFTNDLSHITGKGFDPCLVPETQKVVKYLLEFIDATFPEHYKVLTTK